MSHVYFAGNEASAFTFTSNCIESTSGAVTRYDTNYCRGYLSFTSSSTSADKWTGTLIDPATNATTSLTTLWVHFEWFVTNQSASAPFFSCANSSGVEVVRGMVTGSNAFKVQYWNGSAWVDTGATLTATQLSLHIFDFKIVCGASGSVEVYIDSSLVSSGTIASSSTDNVQTVNLYSTGNTNLAGFSQVLVKDATTILRKVGNRLINAVGNYSAWTGSGTITNINEIPLSDANLITDNANGDKASFKMSALTVTPTKVEAFVVSARINHDASGVQNAKAFIRESSTDYLGNALTVATGLVGQNAIWETDPATSAAWAVAAANSTTLEIGFQANT